MNDFTKDELKELKLILCEAGKGTKPLCYKIASLIDNYCEHDCDASICVCGYGCPGGQGCCR